MSLRQEQNLNVPASGAEAAMIPDTKFLPLVIQLGQFLKAGMDHYAAVKMAGQLAGPDAVAAYLDMKMSTWDPVLSGKKLLDPDTRKAAARFLAGVVVNFVG